MIFAVLLCTTTVASAGRKRIVVLEFEGDKAEKFQRDMVKFLKKKHTVISTSKWNNAADDLSATSVNPSNLKKVAKKLKIDGVITANVEKRRDQYILRVKLYAGTSGKTVGSTVNLKADGPKLDSGAQRDLRDELFDSIDGLEANRGGGGDDEEEEEDEEVAKPAKKNGKKAADDEEEEEKPAKKGFAKKAADDEEEEEEEKKPAKKGFGKKDDKKTAASMKADEDDDDPLPKPAKKAAKDDDEDEEEDDDEDGGKKVAARDGDEDEDEDEDGIEARSDGPKMESARAYSPGERAIDGAIGLSFNARRLSFVFDPAQATKPPGYKGLPVAGLLLDVTAYPLAFGHKRKDMLKNIGITAMYDRVLLIKSRSLMGVELASKQQRYAVGLAFRYPFNKSAMSPVIGATLRYGRQQFSIAAAPPGDTGLPNVNYTIIEPGLFFKYPVNPKIALNAMFGFLAISNTGAIQQPEEYGGATVSGVEGELGGDYLLTKNIFVRATLRFERIGYSFKGTGMKSAGVAGASDTYFGGAATAGYLF